MGDNREAGVFMGHTEGLTYVDSKGDGRYVLSNGKDQNMKLWDLRKMMPTSEASKLDPARYTTKFDYRNMTYDEKDYEPHPHDCSLVTFRGHRVLKTLIRCHFSPPGSTNSRYVYSGSEDGIVYIYNMDATMAGKIDVNQATHHSRPRDLDLYHSTYEPECSRDSWEWKTCVRDASWHPNAPIVAGKTALPLNVSYADASQQHHGMVGACLRELVRRTVGTMGMSSPAYSFLIRTRMGVAKHVSRVFTLLLSSDFIITSSNEYR